MECVCLAFHVENFSPDQTTSGATYRMRLTQRFKPSIPYAIFVLTGIDKNNTHHRRDIVSATVLELFQLTQAWLG
jgi:hypothetical protein